MASVSPILTQFNGGELSPLMDAREDVAKSAAGCRKMRNFIPRVQGPAERRGGTRFVKAVKTAGNRTWLVKFQFSTSVAYELEFGDLYVRFYTLRSPLLSGGVHYEIASPYTAAMLTSSSGQLMLDFEQIGDVIYIAHPNYKPQKLTRVAATNWTFADYAPDMGPFQDQNSDQTNKMYVSGDGAGGATITVTADKAVFTSLMVGMLLRLDVVTKKVGNNGWHPNENNTAPPGAFVFYNFNTYYVTASGDNNMHLDPPIHTEGTQTDESGTSFQYRHSGYGVMRITAFTSSTVVSAVVISTGNFYGAMPDSLVGNTKKSYRWRLGAWGAGAGKSGLTAQYPAAVRVFRDRLWFGSGTSVWGSQPGLYDDFGPDVFGEVTPDSAITTRLPGKQVDDIVWFLASDGMLIGTAGGEFLLSEVASNAALGPGNVKIEPQSHNGSSDVHALAIGNVGMYVDRYGKRLRDIKFDIRVNKYASDDLSLLAEHIPAKQIVSMDYAQTPYSTIWMAMADGTLASFTYNQAQAVEAWAQHPVGGNGIVECVSVIPSPDTTRDDVWLIVRRTINGATVRYVEVLEKSYETGDAQSSCFYVDSGLSYSGAATASFSGLTHLTNQTVAVFADGAPQANQTVDGSGNVTIQTAASVACIGLPFTSTLQTMRLSGGSREGTGQGKVGRISAVIVRFLNTLGLKIGPDENYLDAIDFAPVSQSMNNAPALSSGDSPPMRIDDDYGTNRWITVVQDQPCPATVIGLMPQFSVEEY
jgi:hypothetical protein